MKYELGLGKKSLVASAVEDRQVGKNCFLLSLYSDKVPIKNVTPLCQDSNSQGLPTGSTTAYPWRKLQVDP